MVEKELAICNNTVRQAGIEALNLSYFQLAAATLKTLWLQEKCDVDSAI